jgi:predicted nucleic acid-binding protein
VELADSSAWTTRHRSEVVQRDFDQRLVRGQIATCDAVVFELLRGEQDHRAVAARRADLGSLRSVAIGPRVWSRALDVMESLAERGPVHHRQVPWPDLLVAAAAEHAELPVLHYDAHFEVIAEVTGQPVRALAPLGSLG